MNAQGEFKLAVRWELRKRERGRLRKIGGELGGSEIPERSHQLAIGVDLVGIFKAARHFEPEVLGRIRDVEPNAVPGEAGEVGIATACPAGNPAGCVHESAGGIRRGSEVDTGPG